MRFLENNAIINYSSDLWFLLQYFYTFYWIKFLWTKNKKENDQNTYKLINMIMLVLAKTYHINC